MENLQDILLSALITVLTAAVPVIVLHIRNYLQQLQADIAERLGADKFNELTYWAGIFIQVAEQKFGLEDNAAKREYVYDLLVEMSVKLGIDEFITEDDIDAILEGVFNSLKSGQIMARVGNVKLS